jgi:hypothetical protein
VTVYLVDAADTVADEVAAGNTEAVVVRGVVAVAGVAAVVAAEGVVAVMAVEVAGEAAARKGYMFEIWERLVLGSVRCSARDCTWPHPAPAPGA